MYRNTSLSTVLRLEYEPVAGVYSSWPVRKHPDRVGGGVAVHRLNDFGHRLARQVDQRLLHEPDLARHDRTLVHRAILVVRRVAAEQPELVMGPRLTVAQPLAPEVLPARDPVAVEWLLADAAGDLLGELGRDPLVTVDEQHPFLADVERAERPFALIGSSW
jgi:hypothetical protein